MAVQKCVTVLGRCVWFALSFMVVTNSVGWVTFHIYYYLGLEDGSHPKPMCKQSCSNSKIFFVIATKIMYSGHTKKSLLL